MSSPYDVVLTALDIQRKTFKQKAGDAPDKLDLNISDVQLNVMNPSQKTWHAIRDKVTLMQRMPAHSSTNMASICTELGDWLATTQSRKKAKYAPNPVENDDNKPVTRGFLKGLVQGMQQQVTQQQQTIQQLMPHRQPLAIQNNGVDDKLNQKLDKLLPTQEEAMERYIDDNELDIRDAAIDRYMEVQRKSVARAAIQRYMRIDEEKVAKAAAKLYLQQNPEAVKDAVDEYLDDNPEIVQSAAVEQYKQENLAAVVQGAEEQYMEDNEQEVEERAVDMYLDMYKADVVAQVVKDMPFAQLKVAYERAHEEFKQAEAKKLARKNEALKRVAAYMQGQETEATEDVKRHAETDAMAKEDLKRRAESEAKAKEDEAREKKKLRKQERTEARRQQRSQSLDAAADEFESAAHLAERLRKYRKELADNPDTKAFQRACKNMTRVPGRYPDAS